MSKEDETLKTLEAMLKVANTKDNSDEMVKAFQLVLSLATEMKKSNDELKTKFNGEVDKFLARVEDAVKNRIAEVKDGKTPVKGVDYFDGKPGDPGRNADERTIVAKVIDAIELPDPIEPDMAEDIRNKLELLEGEDRLDASAIKNLPDYDKRLKELEGRPIASGWSAASGGRIVKYYDLSPQLNGSKTSFTLPAFWRVVNVQSSSQPTPMRENIDYIIDGTAMTISFTNTVDPPTTLAQPQTLLIIYAEA